VEAPPPDAAPRIRAAGHRVPIIAMTGHAGAEDRDRCLRAGMDAHLAKPIDSAVLDALLTRWLPTRLPAPAPR
jgi:two-component system sensor histidine kinase BarA